MVIFVKGNKLGYPRLGVSAGKRYGNAVKRNRARRIVREVFRTRLQDLLTPVDLVVLIRAKKGPLQFSTCLKELEHALKGYMAVAEAD